MYLDPQRWLNRKATKLRNRVRRAWTSLVVKDGTIYRIDNKMYQVFDGRYKLIGEVCHMCENLDEIKQSEIL